MSHFAVNYCDLKACQSWREGYQCARDGMPIDGAIKYVDNLHPSERCEVRRQVDKYRLEQMLEE